VTWRNHRWSLWNGGILSGDGEFKGESSDVHESLPLVVKMQREDDYCMKI
jgi:hypothetical protein